MEVFGIGPLEIALVALIAFIVLGPERIPGVMRQLGTWVRQLRETVNNITRDYNADIRQITGEITALQDEIRNIQRDLVDMTTGFITPLPPENKLPSQAHPADPIQSGPDETHSIAPTRPDDNAPSAPSAPTPSSAAESKSDDSYTL